MSENVFHKKRCAINTKSFKANCTCGSTEKWQKRKITELRKRKAQDKVLITELDKEIKRQDEIIIKHEQYVESLGGSL